MNSREQVLQATAWYPPHYVGGTETYVSSLVEELRLRGVASRVLTPREADGPGEYEHHGAPVSTYYVPPALTGSREQSTDDVSEFRVLLQQHDPKIYHQHSWTRGCGLAHLEAAKRAGMKTVLTVHVPGNLCLRGTMMRYGRAPCDGELGDKKCGACWAHSRGSPRIASWMLANLPLSVALRWRAQKHRLSTAMSARALAQAQIVSFRRMLECSDRVVLVSQWLYDAFRLSGAPANKLVLSRQGLPAATLRACASARRMTPKRRPEISLLYLGRCHPVKGIETVVRAIKSLPEGLPVKLSIRTPPGGEEEADYLARLKRVAEADPRITFDGPVHPRDVPATMANYDALLVPSEWLETGPLVVLEAQAAGVYVIGSRLGGIAELVTPETGCLVEPGSVMGWRDAIEKYLYSVQGDHRPAQMRAVKTMASAADEMLEVYAAL